MEKKVFLTGSFGNAGEQILLQLIKQNFNVICFDVNTPSNIKKQKRLSKKHKFETIWGDLRQSKDLIISILKTVPDVM
tara:strand:+ start:694 stop:927 length:234 start_codon:yes stop_codon:yes gene_type:complete